MDKGKRLELLNVNSGRGSAGLGPKPWGRSAWRLRYAEDVLQGQAKPQLDAAAAKEGATSASEVSLGRSSQEEQSAQKSSGSGTLRSKSPPLDPPQ